MLTVDVKGMTCARCVNAITRAIKSLPNVETVSGKAALYRRVLFLNHGEAQSKCSPAGFITCRSPMLPPGACVRC